MSLNDYLLSFGTTGEFGRFRTTTPFRVTRGETAVVRSYRGLELGQVLCEATPGHAQFLPNTTLGKLLRIASCEDLTRAGQMQLKSQELFEAARRLCTDLSLPVEVLDSEMMLDGKQGIVHYLSPDSFDEREVVSRLSRQFEAQVCLHTLSLPADAALDVDDGGCGRPDCGSGEDGHCSSCSSGGCSSCGSSKNDMQELFKSLRERMQASSRTPLA